MMNTTKLGPLNGKLIAGFDRPTDVNDIWVNLRVLPLPAAYSSEDEAIYALMLFTVYYDLAPENYANNVEPQWINPGYNSNSFIRGLLNAAEYDSSFSTGADTPGWDNPVPLIDFGL
jgi:hypothetical protein